MAKKLSNWLFLNFKNLDKHFYPNLVTLINDHYFELFKIEYIKRSLYENLAEVWHFYCSTDKKTYKVLLSDLVNKKVVNVAEGKVFFNGEKIELLCAKHVNFD